MSKHHRGHQIATVWHPDAPCDLLDTNHGNIRVLKGPAAYQLNTAEIVKL